MHLRITNITTLQVDAIVDGAIHRPAGYRNLHRLRIAILFYCGQIKLYP